MSRFVRRTALPGAPVITLAGQSTTVDGTTVTNNLSCPQPLEPSSGVGTRPRAGGNCRGLRTPGPA